MSKYTTSETILGSALILIYAVVSIAFWYIFWNFGVVEFVNWVQFGFTVPTLSVGQIIVLTFLIGCVDAVRSNVKSKQFDEFLTMILTKILSCIINAIVVFIIYSIIC